MPFLDVTDVLSDPDFFDPTLVRRRNAEVVDNDGMNVITSTDTTFSGVPVPMSSLSIMRGVDAEYVKGKISVFTTFDLSAGDDTITADIVLWQGVEYTVIDVDNWPYGQGYVQANCEKKPLR